MIIDRKTNVKYRYGNDRFLCRGLLCGYSKEAIVKIAAYRSGIKEDYYADTMGSNKKAVGEYGGANTVKRIYWLVYGI